MKTALIVGAGIGGLAAGVTLRRAGWQVRVFERAANPRELGFALNLAPNAMAALRDVGVAAEIVRAGYAVRRVEFRGAGGRLLRRLDASGVALESVVAMRTVVHGALLGAVGMDSIELSRDAVGYHASDDGAALTFRDGTAEHGDILIGADGIASVIRRQLHPDEPPPQRSGYAAVRGAVDDVTALLGDLDGVLYFAPRMEVAVVRAGATSAYWYMSLLACDLPRGTTNARHICSHFSAHLDDTFRNVAAATRDDDMRFDVLYQRSPLAAWGRGCVTLLGDAAHPMLPHTGQGAAQAIEDAVGLALALGRDTNAVQALRKYEAVRAVRTAQFVAMGPRIARVTTTDSGLISAIRDAAVRFAPTPLLVRALQNMQRRDPHAALR